jgi:hypothetical protein
MSNSDHRRRSSGYSVLRQSNAAAEQEQSGFINVQSEPHPTDAGRQRETSQNNHLTEQTLLERTPSGDARLSALQNHNPVSNELDCHGTPRLPSASPAVSLQHLDTTNGTIGGIIDNAQHFIEDAEQGGSHGTLVIGKGGESRYLGPTAGSVWLKDVSVVLSSTVFTESF